MPTWPAMRSVKLDAMPIMGLPSWLRGMPEPASNAREGTLSNPSMTLELRTFQLSRRFSRENRPTVDGSGKIA